MTNLEDTLRETLARRAETVTHDRESVDPRVASAPRTGRSPWLYGAVAASVAALAIGLTVTTTSRSNGGIDSDVTSDQVSPVEATTAATALEASPSTNAEIPDSVGAERMLWLPAALPAGYEYREVTFRDVSDEPLAFGDRTTPLWVRRAPTGEVTAIVEILVQPPPATSDASTTNATVHGLPASRRDRPGGTTFTWTESDQLITLETTGLDATDAQNAAESVVVSNNGATLPENDQRFERIDPPSGDGATNPLVEFITIERPGDPTSRLSFSIQAAQDGFTLDHRGLIESRRGTSNGVDFSVSTTFDGANELITAVQNAHVLTINATSPFSDDVLQSILPLESVNPAEIAGVHRSITDQASTLPELDSAVLNDGTSVSVRQGSTSTALCAGDPTTCAYDTSIGGAQPTAALPLLQAFNLNEQALAVGWAPERPDIELSNALLIQGQIGWFILATPDRPTDTQITVRNTDGTSVSVIVPETV